MIFFFCFLLALAFLGIRQARADVFYLFFKVEPRLSYILVEWETSSEINIKEFYVNRSTDRLGGYTRISETIFSRGDSSRGDYYYYIDQDVAEGRIYYYKLEAVDTDNNSQYTEPQSVIAGPTPTVTQTLAPGVTASITPTSTPTTASTLTPSPTSTVPIASPSPLSTTPAPTSTELPYPGPGDSGETPSDGSESINELGTPVTPTLLPFPTVTIEFPKVTPLAELRIEAKSDDVVLAKSEEPNQRNWVVRLGPILFIMLVWFILGGWFYFSLKQLD